MREREWSIELEVLPGLEDFALGEVRTGKLAGEGRITLTASDLDRLSHLRTPTAAYLRLRFEVPRPRALLGQQHLDRLLGTCAHVIGHGSYATLQLSAAGAESSVLTRLKHELATALNLEVAEHTPGDLLVRLRRGPNCWEVLLRTTPRPLSARQWRVCNLPGALNATIAHVMVTLAEPHPTDVFVNVACGSGTLMIERLAIGSAASVTGYDVDESALECGRANAVAAGYPQALEFVCQDATRLSRPDRSVDTVVADLPYAMLVAGQRNAELYPALLAEAARVLKPGGRATFVTTQNRLMRGVLTAQAERWHVARSVPVTVSHRGGYITPTIYALERRG